MQTVIASTPHRVSLAGGATDLEDFYKHHGYGATVGIAIEPFSHVMASAFPYRQPTTMMLGHSSEKRGCRNVLL